jgi:MoxR-like ATPase
VKGVRLVTETVNLAPVVTVDQVREYMRIVNARASEILADQELRTKIVSALAELRSKNIELSDRRKVKLVIVAAAYSILNAESRPTVNSLADALEVVAVHAEEDRRRVEEVVLSQKLRTFDVMRIVAMKEELRRAYEEVKRKGDSVTLQDLELLRRLYVRVAGELENIAKSTRGGRIPREARELYAVAAETRRFLEEHLRALSVG